MKNLKTHTEKTVLISLPIEELQTVITECVKSCLKNDKQIKAPSTPPDFKYIPIQEIFKKKKWVIKSELEIKMDDVFFISLIKALYTTNFLEDKKPFTYIGDDNIKRSYPILCIKGLSDNEEVFYLEYFKVK